MNKQKNINIDEGIIKKALHDMYGIDGVKIFESNEDAFSFSCRACGECCFNRIDSQAIMLSPFDVYRLLKYYKKNNQKNDEFIEKHIGFYIGKNSGIPIARIETKDTSSGKNICTFLKKDSATNKFKCTVHEHKPSACRLFPLGRVSALNHKSSQQDVHYFLQTNVSCGNPDVIEMHTLDEWIPDKIETEKALIDYSVFQKNLLKIIDLHALELSTKIEANVKEAFYDAYIIALYIGSDLEKSFEENFDRGTETILTLANALVKMFSPIDKSILPNKE